MSQQPPQWGPPGYPPQGYYQPPQPPPKTGASKSLIAILAICGTCLACVIFGAIGNKNRGEGSTSTGGGPAPASREYVTEDCAQVAHMFGARSQMSDLQQGEAWRAYNRKWVRWTVTVGDVRESFGGYQMQFRCGTESLIFDGHARFDSSQRQQLLSVQTGTAVRIEGQLTDHGRLMGLSINNASISP